MAVAMALKESDLSNPKEREKHKIAIMGCGRIGLATACLFSEVNFKVTCFNPDPYVTKQINEGTNLFNERELDRMLKRNLRKHRLKATTNSREAVSASDIIFLTAEIPVDGKKRPIYSNLEAICRDIGLNLQPGSLIIVQSIVAPSITENLIIETLEKSSGLEAGVDFGLTYSPVKAPIGAEMKYLKKHARIISAINEQSLRAAKALLRIITNGELVEVSNIKTAEAATLFGDIYQDVSAALSNELAFLCEKMGIDYMEVRKAANKQPHCHLSNPSLEGARTAETPYFLISEAENFGIKLRIAALARKTNNEASKQAYNLIKDAIHSCEKTVKRSKIAVLGVSSHRSVKEARGSQVLELVRLLRKRGGRISVFDPCFASDELSQLGYPAEKTLGKTLERADCLVITVGREEFKHLSLGRIKSMMKKPPVIVDLAHIIDPYEAEREGFIYRGLGRGIWSR
ncbi:TPA: nucleotide sugar dehydrogenase [Candidatus Bathyarchaeota archaeon]|nr:nucleotide sugar dehydrogenase [Candidatus Bathyarchaeota archaeon]